MYYFYPTWWTAFSIGHIPVVQVCTGQMLFWQLEVKCSTTETNMNTGLYRISPLVDPAQYCLPWRVVTFQDYKLRSLPAWRCQNLNMESSAHKADILSLCYAHWGRQGRNSESIICAWVSFVTRFSERVERCIMTSYFFKNEICLCTEKNEWILELKFIFPPPKFSSDFAVKYILDIIWIFEY